MPTYFANKLLILLFGCILFEITAAKEIVATPSPSSLESSSTSLFTGRFSYSIPIYSLEDPDFHLDVTLRYNADGFKPFQPSGTCGQDWTLWAGGCITRSVQDIPDDQRLKLHQDYHNDEIKYIMGMTYAMQNGNIPDKNMVFDMDASVCDTCGILYPLDQYSEPCKFRQADYMPDIFYFNFCGHKGCFVINNQGKATILSGDFVKIDLSNMRDSTARVDTDTSAKPREDSQITIRTLDGYSYIFGGNPYALEYTALCKKNNNIIQKTPYVSAWNLTKIIAPTGRTMTFNYSEGLAQSHNINSLQTFCTDYDWSEDESDGDTLHIVYSLHKECLLQSIQTSDSAPFRVSFTSHPETFKMYAHSDFGYCVPHAQLDSIIVSYGDRVLRTATLSYQYRSYSYEWGDPDDYNWRYLRSVTISGTGRYEMTYDDFNPYPENELYTTPYPRWYPNIYPHTNNTYKNLVDRFGFWKMTSLQGMLREISLPTGGKIKLTYGNHQYGEERRFRVVGNQDVELYTQSAANQSIGGARIEKIETFLEDSTLVETKTFSYTKQGTENSSGIFYNIYELFYPSNLTEGYPIINPYNYNMIDTHIGYSYVQQTTTAGAQSYKSAYSFDTGDSYYTSQGEANTIKRRTDITGYRDSDEVSSGSLTHSKQLKRVGSLLAIENYNGNTLIKSTLYKYNGIPNQMQGMLPNQEPSLGCTDTIVVLSKYSGLITRKLFVYPDVLEQIITRDMDASGSAFVHDKTYTYDHKLRKIKITSTDSRNIRHFTRFTYPDNMIFSSGLPSTSDISGTQLLKWTNRINMPIETVSGYMDGETEYVTDASINLYATGEYIELNPNLQISSSPMGRWRPDIENPDIIDSISAFEMYGRIGYYPYLHKDLSLSLPAPISDYQPMTVINDTIAYDSRYKVMCEYLFDVCNRPQYVKPFGTMPIVYTWAKPDDLYPSAKKTGNQTYTYTYIPYIGVSSVTDPRGKTTYYTYDSAGRLIEEYQLVNGQKQILNVYQYHVKTE